MLSSQLALYFIVIVVKKDFNSTVYRYILYGGPPAMAKVKKGVRPCYGTVFEWKEVLSLDMQIDIINKMHGFRY